MNPRNLTLYCLALLFLMAGSLHAADGHIVLSKDGTNSFVQVRGDKDDDWHIQASSDLVTWTNVTSLGTLLSSGTNPPRRSLSVPAGGQLYYRALKTAGLYDPTLMRTISLTFTQANWSNLMVQAKTSGTYVYGSLLTVDNGATNFGIGARFRGNTSFTGMPPGGGPSKKSIAIAIDNTITNADLMHFNSINLNNSYLDETIMRESVYFTIMRPYTICPAACLARLYINGQYRGVFSQAQQENSDLIREYLPSADGDRWRAPNMDGSGSLQYLGNTNLATYTPHYELKSDYNTNAWPRLINAIYVFNTTATNILRDKAEDVLAVDRWLWFLALENILADDDSYWNKGSDYIIYYEPESGRIHPVEHDGNEAFVAGDIALSPLVNYGSANRPVITRLLGINELRQRYFAHMRTVLQESFNPTNAVALVDQFHRLSADAIASDPFRGYASMTTYTNDVLALKRFITNRWRYLAITNTDLKPVPPNIAAVSAPTSVPAALDVPWITASVQANGTNGLNSVWLYHRGKIHGRFAVRQMFDDGAHGDGVAGDGIYGAATTNYPAGTKVRYYVEARSANAAKAASFSPPRAEQETFSYRVAVTTASNTPVVINEFMASNTSTLADPQGEFEDWIELRNVTDEEVDLTGRYLSDEPNNPRKWAFPAGTMIPADGYLLVWADEDGTATTGLHASFKLSGSGEQIFLTDTDANLNAVLDLVEFGPQETDRSFGRTANDSDVWEIMSPTPGTTNP
jgi:hypothetical protein